MSVKQLGYVIIQTVDLPRWDVFMTEVVGVMRGQDAPEGTAFYRIDDRPFRFWLVPGTSERLTAAGYEVSDRSALDAVAQMLGELGASWSMGSVEDAQVRGVDAFLRTQDPSGNPLEFFVGDKRDDVAFVSPAGVGGFVTGDMGMGHVVFAAPVFDETHSFYKALGFHDTDVPRFRFTDAPDDPGMGFAFMHADNGRHHSVALGEMPMPPSGCIHLMLEMTSQSDVGRCHDRMRRHRIPESATLGRHINDQTFGFYMQTPGGFDFEIGADPLVIDPGSWVPTAHLKPSEWGHLWAWQREVQGPE